MPKPAGRRCKAQAQAQARSLCVAASPGALCVPKVQCCDALVALPGPRSICRFLERYGLQIIADREELGRVFTTAKRASSSPPGSVRTLRRLTFSGGGGGPPRRMGSGAVRCCRHSAGANSRVFAGGTDVGGPSRSSTSGAAVSAAASSCAGWGETCRFGS